MSDLDDNIKRLVEVMERAIDNANKAKRMNDSTAEAAWISVCIQAEILQGLIRLRAELKLQQIHQKTHENPQQINKTGE